MIGALTRYAGHILIFVGMALIASVIPSAAGPPDALAAARLAPVSPAAAGGTGATAPLLIASSRRAGSAAPALAPAGPTFTPATAAEGTPVPAPAVASQEAIEESPGQSEPPAPSPPPTDRIVIPRIRLDTKVVDVGVLPSGEMQTAPYAAGRLEYSAQAGDAGNLVLAGHNDVLGEVFRRLPEVQVGDELTVYRDSEAFTYRVELRTIVREDGATPAQRRDNARWLEGTEDAVATLISCYPYRVDTHRIIVRARLVA